MKILLLGKDSPHRRYIINKLLDMGISLQTCIFQTKSYTPKFEVNSPWVEQEETILIEMFERETATTLDRVKNLITVDRLDLQDLHLKEEIERADFIVVSGADWIKDDLLDAIKHKALNVHMGIAENYRGLDSNLWAWYHGDYRNIGVTLHELVGKLDTGRIFQTDYLDINEKTQVWALRFYEAKLAVELIKSSIDAFGTARYVLKNQEQIGRYYSFMPNVIKNTLSLTPQAEVM